ncbi:MAG: MBOAT family protein [Spirochaetes bacterium]|nr:MBOAT family protein [Spirochaetota bacterium]
MDFTSNITILALILFFLVYFVIYRYFKENILAINIFVAASSLCMYALWYPPAVLILLFYAVLVRYAGNALYQSGSKALLRALVVLMVVILAFFKYYIFFVVLITRNLSSLMNVFVPLGISFFTCTIIGYFIDIHRKNALPPASLLESILFVSFWPSISSGPILRGGNFFQYVKKREPVTRNTFALSAVLIASGIIKKILIADNLGSFVNWNFAFGVARLDVHEAWATMIGFIGQIYGDFSGYSDMAIGFALLLGFRLPANFNYPYIASSLGELWRRWHMSFSFWLRDYVYIPLGGSRKGRARKYLNLLITFVVSGIWHGTGLNFIIWGSLQGLVISIEDYLGPRYTRLNRYLRRVITFFIFVTAATFFRLDAKHAVTMLSKMFFYDSLNFRLSTASYFMPLLLVFGFVVIDHWLKFYRVNDRGFPEINSKPHVVVILCVLLLLALVFPGQDQPFIYFKF